MRRGARHRHRVSAPTAAAALTWPVPSDLDDAGLEARLVTRPVSLPASDRQLPDLAQVHQELKRPGVTLALLRQEYRAAQPCGYGYSQFASTIGGGRVEAVDASDPSRRREGFVEFSGTRPQLVDPRTGALIPVELFLGALGASGLIYAEATGEPGSAGWVSVHVRMLEYWQGSPATWVPDHF